MGFPDLQWFKGHKYQEQKVKELDTFQFWPYLVTEWLFNVENNLML